MRTPALLLLVLSVAFAGCFGDAGGDAPPVGSSPAVSSPPPTASSPVIPTPTAPPEPPAKEAEVVYNGSHDFTGPPPLPNAPPTTENFTVDAGYATLQVRVAWTSASSGPTGDVSLSAQATVRLVDPAGTAVLECTGKDDPDCSKDLPAPAEGGWKVEYSGSGTGKVTVTITQSP